MRNLTGGTSAVMYPASHEGVLVKFLQKPGLDFSVIVRWSRNAAAG
jgi:hypothetical protein